MAVPRDLFRQSYFWRAVGERMGIAGIPDDYAAYERFNVAYERDHFRPNPATARVGAATRDMMLGWFPAPLRPLLRPYAYAVMDEPMRTAFGFPPPPGWARRLVPALMRLRARVLRRLPPRRRPRLPRRRSTWIGSQSSFAFGGRISRTF